MSATCPALPSVPPRGFHSVRPVRGIRRKSVSRSADALEERNQVLLDLLPEVRHAARRIHRRLPAQIPLEDLYQTGVLGLVDALSKFDPRKNVQIQTYAKFRIRGAILDGLRELDWGSRDQRRKAREVEKAELTLRVRMGRTPTQEEIAGEMGVALDAFHQLAGELRGLSVGSLDEVAQSSEEGAEQTYKEQLAAPADASPFHACADAEQRERLARAIAQLPESEQRVLSLYYYEDLTMQEIGEVLSLGESRISQIHSAAMAHLRSALRQARNGVSPRRPSQSAAHSNPRQVQGERVQAPVSGSGR